MIKTNRHPFFVFISFTLVLMISSCSRSIPTPTPLPIQDGGFFSKDPCGPPCFFNITPGVSTEEETGQILKDRGFWDSCEGFDGEAESGGRGIVCGQTFLVGFQYGKNIVDVIGFLPEEPVMVEDVIAVYGEPDVVILTITGIAEYPALKMALFFDSIHTVISLPELEGPYEVKPETVIENIGYFDESSYSVQRRNYPSEWKGYGVYKMIPR